MTDFSRTMTFGRPKQILLPVSPWFIAASLLMALVLNLLPWGQWIGVPDFVALVLVFWSIHHPRKVGMGVAFLFGLAMDVHEAAVLGEHALAYTLLSYAAISLHRRILWFPPLGQALHVLILFLIAQGVILLVRMLLGAGFPGLWMLLDSVVQALLWPLTTFLLLAPQRRALQKDETRPI
jgi:rod shape-determining protein MreD